MMMIYNNNNILRFSLVARILFFLVIQQQQQQQQRLLFCCHGLRIRLMSYNIHAWRDSQHDDSYDRIVDCINQIKPDILCLNEVLHPFCKPSSSESDTTSNDDDYYSHVQNQNKQQQNQQPVTIPKSFIPTNQDDSYLYKLANATNLRKVEYVGATNNSYFGYGCEFGNAILTNLNITKVKHCILVPDPDDIHLGDQQRDYVDPRAITSIQISFADDDNNNIKRNRTTIFGICVTHLDHKSEPLRKKQILKGIQDCVVKCFYSSSDDDDDDDDDETDNNNNSNDLIIPHIICGDWNTFQKSDYSTKDWNRILDLYNDRGWEVPPSKSLVIEAIKELGYKDTFYEANKRRRQQQKSTKNHDIKSMSMHYPSATAWSHQPIMRIDHAFIKQKNSKNRRSQINIKILDHFVVDDTDASDHYPIVVDMDMEIS